MSDVVVLHNLESGTRRIDTDRIAALMQAAGLQACVKGVMPAELADAAAAAVRDGAHTIVAAGGDGTVGTVASVVAESRRTFGVLPVGTLNHFARDAGIPLDLVAAVQTIAGGRTRQVDIGQVNGRNFLNNCSIGLYPRIVKRRDGQRHRLGRGRWFAMALAAISVFRRYPLVKVTVQIDGRTVRCTSPLVFVGNNRYEINLLDLGRRRALDGGVLSVYLANAPSRWSFLRMMLRGLTGRLHQDRDFQTMLVTSFTIESRKKRLRVAIDGEVVRIKPPLTFHSKAGALRVVAP